jgi:hypothetical protein
MSRSNDVFNVLIPSTFPSISSGDAGDDTKNKIDHLLDGQLGFFNRNSNKRLVTNPNTTSITDDFYLAWKSGSGVRFSAGQYIPLKGLRNISYKASNLLVPQIDQIQIGVKIEDLNEIISKQWTTEYGIKVEFSNQRIYRMIGENLYAKTFTSQGGCLKGCPAWTIDDIEQWSAAKKLAVYLDLIDNIKKNADDLLKVRLVAKEQINGYDNGNSSTGGARYLTAGTELINPILGCDTDSEIPVTDDGNNIKLLYSDIDKLAIEIETMPIEEHEYCNINVRYYKDRATTITTTILGFPCFSNVETTKVAKSSSGSGYDLRGLEYQAGGWEGNPGPYRTYSVTGLAKDGFNYQSEVAKLYDLYILQYEFNGFGSERDNFNFLSTIIAVEGGDINLEAYLRQLAKDTGVPFIG